MCVRVLVCVCVLGFVLVCVLMLLPLAVQIVAWHITPLKGFFVTSAATAAFASADSVAVAFATTTWNIPGAKLTQLYCL